MKTSTAMTAAKALLGIMDALDEVIVAAGPQGLPSGELYAHVMGRLSLQNYEWCIDLLVKAGRITRKNHLLTSTRVQ